MTNTNYTNILGARIALGLFLTALLLLSWRVLSPFIIPVAWAAILVYVTWPIYHRLRSLLRRQVGLSALLMTLFLSLTFALPLLSMVGMLQREVPAAYNRSVEVLLSGPEAVPPAIAHIPWLGDEIQRVIALSAEDPETLRRQVVQWGKPWVDGSLDVLGGIGFTAFKFIFALFTAFFFYRDGEELLDQVRRLLYGLIGARSGAYLFAIGSTTRAVLYGLVLTALAQGVLAGLGYWAVGVQAPVLLGALTAILALVPFGTPLVWGVVSIWLLASGHTWAGLGLAAWGILVVSQIDNILRPMLISSSTRIPYLLVLFSVLGGISAFGLLGLFLGPIVIAVLLAVWREWLEEQMPRSQLTYAGERVAAADGDDQGAVARPQD
ncbi:AI-2E family transporter [uncultured Thiodictyon sp.]|uniref:AI-2E family transporter n=1 Tax=uncultured Thiodictyon sp. TaxID=1846217 RepID=UPI0025DCEF3A|nr:AI-2E family transporter [uncultured Thiodictyon sp.]